MFDRRMGEYRGLPKFLVFYKFFSYHNLFKCTQKNAKKYLQYLVQYLCTKRFNPWVQVRQNSINNLMKLPF